MVGRKSVHERAQVAVPKMYYYLAWIVHVQVQFRAVKVDGIHVKYTPTTVLLQHCSWNNSVLEYTSGIRPLCDAEYSFGPIEKLTTTDIEKADCVNTVVYRNMCYIFTSSNAVRVP